MTHAETYSAMVDAYNSQISRRIQTGSDFDRWDTEAVRFRYDPQAALSPALQVLASHLNPQDVLIDVGGGGGRVSLAMAHHCQQVINVEPSSGMGAKFELSKSEAGLTNARWIQADWTNSDGIGGDVVFTRNVTFFIEDIQKFINRLRQSAGRRVIICNSSTPPPNQYSPLVQLVYGETHALVPGYRELLPVLWDIGILPEVLIPSDSSEPLLQTRDRATDFALQGVWLSQMDRPRAKEIVEEHFDDLFSESAEGYRPLWRSPSREMIITWETSHS